MGKGRILYRSLKGYEYELAEDYCVNVGIEGWSANTSFLLLELNGMLTIRRGYAWDGPSGPALDTKSFMRGSLVHDALYQLMRGRRVPLRYRHHADELLGKHCREDGMSRFRAWYVVKGVKLFGKNSAEPQPESRGKLMTAP